MGKSGSMQSSLNFKHEMPTVTDAQKWECEKQREKRGIRDSNKEWTLFDTPFMYFLGFSQTLFQANAKLFTYVKSHL